MTEFETVVSTIRQLKPELASRFGCNSIGLFGSIVRDDFSSSNSDIDIIVDFSRPIGAEFIDMAEFLESVMKRKVDLVSRGGIKSRYLNTIEADIVYV